MCKLLAPLLSNLVLIITPFFCIPIEEEVLAFYGNLMGKACHTNDCIDIVSIREGAQLNNDQKSMLITPVTTHEIMKALNGIGDMKAHGLDGYGAIFFKATWSIIEHDVIDAIMDFFMNERMYKAINSTMVTLSPKSSDAKAIKEYMPIS